MTNPNKNKGSSWERDCAKLLTKTLGYHFERNKNGSGAFLGRSHIVRKQYLSETQIVSSLADVIPPTECKRMCIECKFYKEFPFHHFLINKEIPLLDEWIQQQLDIIDETNFWFVAFKINFAGSYIAIPLSLCNDFIDEKLGNHSIYHYKNEKYIIADFEHFIKTYKNEILKKSA